MQTLTIQRPDDLHIHLRDTPYLGRTVTDVARTFNRCIVMPNLKSPVTTVAAAELYRTRLLTAHQHSPSSKAPFTPLMTLYLTDESTPQLIKEAKASGIIYGCKLYPQGATTNSSNGVTDVTKLYGVFEQMQESGMPLLVHGEVTDIDVDVFDREAQFIETILAPIVTKFTKLKVVLEHITTQDAVKFVQGASNLVAATITPHHLRFNRNALFVGGIRPHYYCLPILKRRVHQEALQQAAISGNPKFFLGTDSAPHSKTSKESDCGCAGIYSAHAAIEIYAEIFESLNSLDKLEAFSSHFGADFYGLKRNTDTITLIKTPWQVPVSYAYGDETGTETLIPLSAGETLQWQIQE